MDADHLCTTMRSAAAWALRSIGFHSGALLVDLAPYEVDRIVPILLSDMERFGMMQRWAWSMLEQWRNLWLATRQVPYESNEAQQLRLKDVAAALPGLLREIPLPSDTLWRSIDSKHWESVICGVNLFAEKEGKIWSWKATKRGCWIASGRSTKRIEALENAESSARGAD